MRHLEIEITNTAELLAPEAYGGGALLRWERSATEAGAYVEGGTVALVAGSSLYDVWDAAGIETTWYRWRISNTGGTTFSAYSAPLSPVTSLVSIAEVRALVKSRLSDVDLQAVIDGELGLPLQKLLCQLVDVALSPAFNLPTATITTTTSHRSTR